MDKAGYGWGAMAIRLLEIVLTAVMAVLVLDVLWGVATRFLLGSPSRWTEEVATFLLIWASLLGASVAFARGEHLGVDYFVNKLAVPAQTAARIFVQFVVLAFVSAAMIFGGYVLVSQTLEAGQLTPALEMKMGYVYLAVPVSGIAMVISSVERIVMLIRGQDRAACPSAVLQEQGD